MINQNEMAIWIAAEESGKKEISIGQIKEVMKLTLDYLAEEEVIAVLQLLEKHEA